MSQTIACPERGLLCAYTGREPDRCPWCHTRWSVILARRSHSCEVSSAWHHDRHRRVTEAARMRRDAAQEAAGGAQGRSQPSPQVRTPGAAR